MPQVASPPMHGSSILRPIGISLVLALLLFLPQIAAWTDETNRYFYFWQRSDAVAVILAILATAGLILAIQIGFRRARKPVARQVGRALFLLAVSDAVLGYILSDIAVKHDAWEAVAWGVLSGIMLLVAFGTRLQLVRYVADLCFFLSPLGVILFGQMLLWPSWDIRPGALRQLETNPPHPVFLFIFDEWSAHRSGLSGSFHPFFSNLRGLAAGATTFTHALTDGVHTEVSIPRLLFATDGDLRLTGNQAFWEVDGQSVPSARVPSMFAEADSLGYTTALTGFYLPYRAILGDQVDYVATSPHVPKAGGVPGNVLLSLGMALSYLPDPVSRLTGRRLQSHWYSRNWVRLNHESQRQLRKIVAQAGERSFAVVHVPLPHAPFVFNADGTYRGPYRGERMDGTPADYERHLRYLDAVLGDMLDVLRTARLFDSSLIIITSDHSWKLEPDTSVTRLPDAYRWVPLVVKLPGQVHAARVDRPFCLKEVRGIIDSLIGSSTRMDSLPCRTGLIHRRPNGP
jgi:hypothetical protein